TELFAAAPRLDVAFRRCGRFSGVLYLAPEPAPGLRALTEAMVARWPEAPPYGGAHDEIVPHLTVAMGHDEPTLAAIEGTLHHGLPLTARLGEAWLVSFDGARWGAGAAAGPRRRRARLTLSAPGRPDGRPRPRGAARLRPRGAEARRRSAGRSLPRR